MSTRRVFTVAVLLAITAVVGCQSTGGGAASSEAAPTKAVIASTGNGTTTIYLPSGKGVQTLSTSGAGVCERCAADAAAYFQGAALDAKCPQCGATRTAALGHQ